MVLNGTKKDEVCFVCGVSGSRVLHTSGELLVASVLSSMLPTG